MRLSLLAPAFFCLLYSGSLPLTLKASRMRILIDIAGVTFGQSRPRLVGDGAFAAEKLGG